MQVSQVQDHVTHAVIGGGQTIDFAIAGSAEFFNILSSTLYKNQKLAVVRETLCNAWDAHVEAGITDTAVQITLDKDKFVIKDFGRGIHKDDIGIVYGTYGNSTKKHDGKQTGGFGLGCKAPFAYTDHFEVISCHDGVKTIYNMSKSASAAMGKPGIIPIGSFPTTETGLQVTIRLSPGDMPAFRDMIRQVVYNGDMLMELNGDVLPKINFDHTKSNFLLVCQDILEGDPKVMVRYGNVIYPVDTTTELNPLISKVTQFNQKLSRSRKYRIIFQASPHSISVQPSREGLSMQTHTINTLKKLMEGYLEMTGKPFSQLCKQMTSEVLDEAIKEAAVPALLDRSYKLPAINQDQIFSVHSELVSMAREYISHYYPSDFEFRKNDVTKRVSGLMQAGLLDKGMAQTFLKELNDLGRKKQVSQDYSGKFIAPTHWLQKRVLAPLAAKLQAASMPLNNLYVFDPDDGGIPIKYRHDTSMPPLVHFKSARPKSIFNCLPYLRNLVILTNSTVSLWDKLMNDDKFIKEFGAYHGFIIYHVGRKNSDKEAARNFFKGTSFNILDLTLQDAIAPKVKRVQNIAPRKPVKKGLVCLSATKNTKSIGNLAIKNFTLESAPRIEKPEAVIKLSTGVEQSNYMLMSGLSHSASHQIVEMFGSKIGIATTQPMYEKWVAAGAAEFKDYIVSKVCEFIKGNTNIKKAYSQSVRHTGKVSSINWYEYTSLLEIIKQNKALAKEFNLENALSDEEQKYIDLWEALSERFCRDHDAAIELQKELRDISTDPALKVLVDKLEKNPYLRYVDMGDICRTLGNEPIAPESYKTAYEMLQFILK